MPLYKKGKFSAKSAYKLDINSRGEAITSTSYMRPFLVKNVETLTYQGKFVFSHGGAASLLVLR